MTIRMTKLLKVLMIAAFCTGLQTTLAAAQVAAGTELEGAVYRVSQVTDSESSGGAGASRGSSHDQDSVIERVIAVHADGIELEYDLLPSASEQERARNWQFPLRVFKPVSGATRILNATELERRIEGWLALAKLPREACGKWYFTWNAFKVECDPQSALVIAEAYDMRPGALAEGMIYRDPRATSPTNLTMIHKGVGTVFSGEMPIDPELVQKEKAQSDVVVGEITRKRVTLEAALAARLREQVTGTIAVSFEVLASGFVSRRTTVTKTKTIAVDGTIENVTITSVLSREPFPSPNPLP